MKLTTTILSIFTIGSLSACAVFEPAYPEDIRSSATSGQEEVSQLVAGMELGHFTSPKSYVDNAKRYETVVGDFTTVRNWVASQTGSNLPRAKAADLMLAQIDGCLEVVMAKAGEHKKFGLQAGKAHTSVRVACEIPTNNIIK